MPRPSAGLVAAVAAAAFVLGAPARAHVIVSPTFLPVGETQTIELSVPNERDAPMTGFVVTAPAGLDVSGAESAEGWSASVEGQVATWSGGSLPAKLSVTFGLKVRANAEPGQLELQAEQRYADGEVRWSVALTIVPGSDATGSDSGSSGLLVGAIVAIGLFMTAAISLLARRRRAGPTRSG
jgi:hypothetical protein